jgi:hypothetical protein
MRVRSGVASLLILLSALMLPPTSAADTDARAVTREHRASHLRHLGSDDNRLFKLDSQACVVPGDIIKFRGDDLQDFTDYHLALRTERRFVALKRLSISKQQLIMQLPRDTALKRGQRYRLLLLSSKGTNVSRQLGLSLKLCPAVNRQALLPQHPAHESGEILVLSHSGLIDEIIDEGSKLGYLLLRRQQLNSINQTLLVLGGSDKKLTRGIKKLRATFKDARIDFNHFYQISSTQQPQAQDLSQPAYTVCPAHHSRVVVGMLDGEINLSTPSLSGKAIKTRQFLLPGQSAETRHATATAELLVGSRSHAGTAGLAPFIELKSASVIRQAKHESATAEALARALDWFMNEKVQLVNMPLTSPTPNRIADYLFAESINKGLVIFAAAGNAGQRLTSAYPAALPGVIAITAVNSRGELTRDANQGNYIDFAASSISGSSSDAPTATLAVPNAVSIAAVYLSQQANMSRQRLFENMQFNAVDRGSQGYDKRYGWGQLQLNDAMCQF